MQGPSLRRTGAVTLTFFGATGWVLSPLLVLLGVLFRILFWLLDSPVFDASNFRCISRHVASLQFFPEVHHSNSEQPYHQYLNLMVPQSETPVWRSGCGLELPIIGCKIHVIWNPGLGDPTLLHPQRAAVPSERLLKYFQHITSLLTQPSSRLTRFCLVKSYRKSQTP